MKVQTYVCIDGEITVAYLSTQNMLPMNSSTNFSFNKVMKTPYHLLEIATQQDCLKNI